MKIRRALLRGLLAAGLLAGSSSLAILPSSTPAEAATGCQDVLAIWARGSGSTINAGEARRFRTSVADALPNTRFAMLELGNLDSVFEPGTMVTGPGRYIATGGPSLQGVVQWAVYPTYDRSVEAGTNELVAYLNERASRCPKETFVLGGYSQGSDAIGRALSRTGYDGYDFLVPATKKHIGYVAFYGDPKFNAGDAMERKSGRSPGWVRGNAPGWGYQDYTTAVVRHDGLLGPRSPYFPTYPPIALGSWCDADDRVCNGDSAAIIGAGNHGSIYENRWIAESAQEIARAANTKMAELNGAPPPNPLFHGPVPDATIIQSTDSNLYVSAGGKLFWFDKNNSGMLNAFRSQMQQKYGTTSYPVMAASEVHAVEVNRTSTGAYSPGTNMPADNTFLYEYGTTQQYVVKFQHPFPVVSQSEAIALGGQNKAVMVPPGLGDLQAHPAQWIQNDLLRFGTDPSVWHYAGSQGFRVPGVPTRDCLQARWNRGVTLMPGSAWNYFPTHPTQQAACDFTHGQWLYGTGSNRQVEVLYGVGHYVQAGEVVGLGGTNQAKPVSDATVDWLMSLPLNLPANHLFKAPNTPSVYSVQGGQFHLVGSPAVRDCLMATYGVVVETVPQSFLDKLPRGDGAQCPYEGRQLLGTGGSVDYVQNGSRHHVQNPTIRDCLIGRAGTGQPIAVDAATWNSYGQGSDAYCPYEGEVGLNFVQEAGDPTVWLVHAPTAPGQPGTKQHVGSLCVPDPYTTQLKKYHVWTVPRGETAGHTQGPDFWQSGAVCQGLPG